MRFDVGDVADLVTADDVIQARLVIYLHRVKKKGELTLHAINTDWHEAPLNNTTRPEFNPTPLARIPAEAVIAKQFIIVDVTAQVKAWLASPQTDYGFALVSDTIADVRVTSKEGSAIGHPATLQIDRVRRIANTDLPDSIDAAKLGVGNVDNNEYGALDGVTSSLQPQLDSLTLALAGNYTSLSLLAGQVVGLGNQTAELGASLGSKVNKNGDTMDGLLRLPVDGLVVGADQLTFNEGNVGIGFTSPTAKLQVKGELKFGASGELSPSASQEQLRIIRGGVTISGSTATVTFGSGFSVVRNGVGNYTITFDLPFTGPPAVTANVLTMGDAFSETYGRTMGVSSLLNNRVTITGSFTGGAVDCSFTFLAVGPR